MAKKVVVQLIDDIDGSVAEETVQFSVDGTNYEVDLSAENAQKLRDDFARWIQVAHKAGTRKAAARKAVRNKVDATDAAKIREWARGKGIEVSERGRIPEGVRDQYLAEVGGA